MRFVFVLVMNDKVGYNSTEIKREVDYQKYHSRWGLVRRNSLSHSISREMNLTLHRYEWVSIEYWYSSSFVCRASSWHTWHNLQALKGLHDVRPTMWCNSVHWSVRPHLKQYTPTEKTSFTQGGNGFCRATILDASEYRFSYTRCSCRSNSRSRRTWYCDRCRRRSRRSNLWISRYTTFASWEEVFLNL